MQGAASPTFTADTSTLAGKYTLAATSGGVTKESEVDISTADMTDVLFAFP